MKKKFIAATLGLMMAVSPVSVSGIGAEELTSSAQMTAPSQPGQMTMSFR